MGLTGFTYDDAISKYYQCLFHWNGYKFSKEFKFSPSLEIMWGTDYKSVNNCYFVLYVSDTPIPFTILLKGKPKYH
jgi:hypothetical protein